MSEPVVIGDATLYHGDCLEILPTLGKVDAIVTDPPYGIGYKASCPSRINSTGNVNLGEIIGDNQPFDPTPFLDWPCVLFGADHFCNKLPEGGVMHVWDKHCGRASNDYFSDAELFWINRKSKRYVFRYLWKGIQQEGKGEKRYHPMAKPIELMKFCIMVLKVEGVIFDPFMGSGTTGVACADLGRKFIGIEIERKYFDIACERIEAAYSQMRLFA